MRTLAWFNPSAGQGTVAIGATSACSTLIVQNDSPYGIRLTFAGYDYMVLPYVADRIVMPQPVPTAEWRAEYNTGTATAPTSRVNLILYDQSETVYGQYPVPLVRQTSGTAEVTGGSINANVNGQTVNVGNPVTVNGSVNVVSTTLVGTSFPASPIFGQLFLHTIYRQVFMWTGTRWETDKAYLFLDYKQGISGTTIIDWLANTQGNISGGDIAQRQFTIESYDLRSTVVLDIVLRVLLYNGPTLVRDAGYFTITGSSAAQQQSGTPPFMTTLEGTVNRVALQLEVVTGSSLYPIDLAMIVSTMLYYP